MAKVNSLQNVVRLDYSNMSFNSAISDIILLSKNNNPVVVLEGIEDYKIMNKFFDARVKCLPGDGKGNVVKIFGRLPKTYTMVVGIADRDYELNLFLDSRLFYYDSNNLEMMCTSDDRIFDKVDLYNKYGKNFTKNDLINLKNNILLNLLPISIFRMINMQELTRKIAAETLISDLFSCMKKNKADVIAEIKESINNMPDISSSEKSLTISKYDLALANNYDLSAITQGHDFSKIFANSIGLIKTDAIYNLLNRAFSSEIFMATELYKSIKKYEIIQTLTLLK